VGDPGLRTWVGSDWLNRGGFIYVYGNYGPPAPAHSWHNHNHHNHHNHHNQPQPPTTTVAVGPRDRRRQLEGLYKAWLVNCRCAREGALPGMVVIEADDWEVIVVIKKKLTIVN